MKGAAPLLGFVVVQLFLCANSEIEVLEIITREVFATLDDEVANFGGPIPNNGLKVSLWCLRPKDSYNK